MVENESISKKERMDIQPSGDLLSDLPLGIIHSILARVPIRDAVRTSLLSRQWRYKWASLPYLVFDSNCVSVSSSIQEESVKTRLCPFITQALIHHKGLIHQCKISVCSKSKLMGIDECILCLSRKDIKAIDLHLFYFHNNDEMVQVPSSIYSCENLTQLWLDNDHLDPPPSTFKGFLFLRCLVLRGSLLSPNTIESLVANSPLLETFNLHDASYDSNQELRVSAPNLTYLNIKGYYKEICVYAPLLAVMSVTLLNTTRTTDHDHQHKSSVCNYVNFMGGFTNLEKLSGGKYFTKYLSTGIESCHHTLVFHQLKDIELCGVNVSDKKYISVVGHLIVGAPNLEKLKIYTVNWNEENNESEEDDEPEARRHLSFRDFGCGPNFTFEKLSLVMISEIRGLPLEMELIKFLLESSPVLETMDLACVTNGKLKVASQLLGFCRASSKARIYYI